MAFLSELLNITVTDADNQTVGQLKDLLASIPAGAHHPVITGLAVQQAKQLLLLPVSTVAALFAPAIPLNLTKEQLTGFEPDEHEFYLVRDVLDKQIIDTNGVRVVRVNDLELGRVNGHYYILNVDIGYQGIWRRLGLPGTLEKFAHLFSGRQKPGVISWDDVEFLPGGQPMRLKVSSDKITELHPADLAEIISDLNRAESSKFLESLDVKTAADMLEEVESDFQASLVETMADEKVADILEEMAPDEAADLLAELPEDRSAGLLNLMEQEDAADVRRLLSYPEDSAGGIMTTEYVTIRNDLTAQAAIAYLREHASDEENIFYVYVTGENNRLSGVFSLSDLVIAPPDQPVTAFMHRRMVTVRTEDPQEKVAQLVAKYNLLAVPVVDEQERLQGIVTADDALDKIIPTKWKKRLPRLYR